MEIGVETRLFDLELYGAKCRKRRQDLGYKTADAFAASVRRRTDASITRDILYKIEQGRQEPGASLFLALNLSLWGDPFPFEAIGECLSKDFAETVRMYRDKLTPDEMEELSQPDYYGRIMPLPPEYGETNPWIPLHRQEENTSAAIELEEVKQFENLIDSVSDTKRTAHRAIEVARALGEPASLFCDMPVDTEGNRAK